MWNVTLVNNHTVILQNYSFMVQLIQSLSFTHIFTAGGLLKTQYVHVS